MNRRIAAAVAAVAAISASACRRESPPDLIINNVAEPATLDPGMMQGVPEHRLAMALYEGLCNYDPRTVDGTPGAAERWDLSEDGRTYTFHLRPTAKWSNGDPVTAEDFRYSWLRVLGPTFPTEYEELLFLVSGAEEYRKGENPDPDSVAVRALDPRTLQVTFINRAPFLPQLLCHMTFMPVHRASVERYGNEWTRPGKHVGNGPYRLVSRQVNREITMERNPHYWDAANVPLQRIQWLPVGDLLTGLTMYDGGQCPWMTDLPMELIDQLKARSDCRLATYLGTYYYRLNVEREGLRDPKVRRALALAIDRVTLCRDVMRAGQQPAYHFVPPVLTPYESPVLLRFDPDEARRLMAEAGFAGGRGFPKLRILYNTLEQHRMIAAFIQEQWRTYLGIEVELENAEWKTYLDRTNSYNYDIGRAGWIADYGDPDTFLMMWIRDGGHNYTHWASDRYDELLHQARREDDPGRRLAEYREMEEILMNGLPIIPLYFYVSKNLIHPSVAGVHDNYLDQHPLMRVSRASGVPAD